MDLTYWQSLIPENTPLSLINIPGTHDSSTQYVTLSPFSRCQGKNIFQQLEAGIRLLDIRLELRDSEFYAVHGIADCRTSKKRKSPLLRFEDTFASCVNFLHQHPTETVIISLKMERGNNRDSFFPSFYNQFIEPNLKIWYLENRIPVMGECRGKLVLMRRCDIGSTDKGFTDQQAGINFTKMTFADPVKNDLFLICPFEQLNGNPAAESAMIQDKYMLNPKAKWKKAVKAALDNAEPDKSKIFINFLSTAGFPFLPVFNSRAVNSNFKKYELKNKKAYGWIVTDFQTEELNQKIIQSNF